VLLLNLAATPEAENHGAIVAAMRDWLHRENIGAAPLVIVDESAYAARMGNDASLEPRLAERRRLWKEFLAGYALQALFVNLSGSSAAPGAQSAAGPIEPALRESVREALLLSAIR
jgi:hypothetical protein